MRALTSLVIFAGTLLATAWSSAADRLVFHPPQNTPALKHVVLVSGDEEYRTEESMPMLAKILSQKHGFKCTVLFAFGPDGADYIDPNSSSGIRGWDALSSADLMIIGTRFRKPSPQDAKHIADYINAGKPIIGLRTATHAFNGEGDFDGLKYPDFGLKILGETWVSHHGKHKVEGARAVTEPGKDKHPILRSVGPFFAPSDVYGVTHLTPTDEILLRGAVTETLDPSSPNVKGKANEPMQALAWLHGYTSPNGKKQGKAFCTTAGASVDFVDESLRRMIVNAAYHLTGREVPSKADVDYIDPFYPSFYGFINDKEYFKKLNIKPEDFGLGKSPKLPDPKGSPEWNFRPQFTSAKASKDSTSQSGKFVPRDSERVAMVGSSLAERMNLFGYFESLLLTRFPEKHLVVRNFGWPADEVGKQQRPDNYTTIDDPLVEFGPELFICFFGFNEHFAGDSAEALSKFKDTYRSWIEAKRGQFSKPDRPARFILVSPIAQEKTSNPLLPDGVSDNAVLAKYAQAVSELATELKVPFVDLFKPTQAEFAKQPNEQFTLNGIHLNQAGDRFIAQELDKQLFPTPHPTGMNVSLFEKVRAAVNDKSWYHSQDYRMLNGWYVYGGRRTWDTETFPGEYQKIRKMVGVRDKYIWDMIEGKPVPEVPDDSKTGEVYIPPTMFGTRDDAFREKREPKTLVYPTPEESIAQMKVPDGFEVQLFASEREFPELANPTQIAFDTKGRLWVSCMVNYPQWLPGSAKPGDKLLIFEDTNNDGKADVCKTFYDKLICPTGFEFYEDGVLVVDEPRIIFLKDTDGDDKADEVTQLIDGIATDDTHHAMGAWEWSHGGLLYMLEGVSMSTTMETPWGPFRNKGPSGAYILDPKSMRFHYFRTPGYGNPWCMVFDQWGMGTVGDGTGAQQHWSSPLSGFEVPQRRTLRPNFDNQGMRPVIGSEFLLSRHLPDDVQGQFIYACVINMHGLTRFQVGDDPEGAGYAGKRIPDLIDSPDNFFRPIDPQIGPDGAIWFGDWCNALIGHMQYSQRDPNRDHEHGRMYRLVNKNKPLLKPVLQKDKSIDELLAQLEEYEPRTRYRARRELRARPKADVLAAVDRWLSLGNPSPNKLCEGLWLQESFRELNPALVERVMASEEMRARAAAVHCVSNEYLRYPEVMKVLAKAVNDPASRVRLEALRGLSFMKNVQAAEIALQAVNHPLDYWTEYTLEHTLQALLPYANAAEKEGKFLVGVPDAQRTYYENYKLAATPGGAAIKPLKEAEDPAVPQKQRLAAIQSLAKIGGGDAGRGQVVFSRVCAGCHMVGDTGKEFGPRMDMIALKYKKEDLIKHILWPNEEIAKGYETVQVLTVDGIVINGFIISENDKEIKLGVATQDGKGKEVVVEKDAIELRKEMKASSMPEGLVKTIAPGEFLDLIAYVGSLDAPKAIVKDGWTQVSMSEGKLRTFGEFEEISRDAEVRYPKDFPDHWMKYSSLLLSGADPATPGGREFAFHSPNDPTESPNIVIRLSEDSEVRHVTIQNRRGGFHDRAKDLAVWVSSDGEKWKQVWKSEAPTEMYEIDLPAGTKARYIKVGLDGKGIFHLNQVAIFGKK
jgi:putative heme-binding domain-containing protein